MTPQPPMATARAVRPHRGAGLLLVVPAALTGLISLVVPTGQTIVRSLQHGGGMLPFARRSGAGGVHNYTELLGHSAFWKALVFSLSFAVVPVLVMLLVGPSLAAALDRAGTWPRRAGRLLLSLPLVVFSPIALAAAWLTGQSRDGKVATAFGKLSAIRTWTPTVPLITAAAMFGFLCGLALLVFLPVMRGRTRGRSLTPAMLAVGSITLLAAVAAALQAFSFALTLGFRQPTLATSMYRSAFQFFDFGGGSAISTLTGLMLGVLGVLATFIAIRTGLRLDLGPPDAKGPATGPTGHRPGPEAYAPGPTWTPGGTPGPGAAAGDAAHPATGHAADPATNQEPADTPALHPAANQEPTDVSAADPAASQEPADASALDPAVGQQPTDVSAADHDAEPPLKRSGTTAADRNSGAVSANATLTDRDFKPGPPSTDATLADRTAGEPAASDTDATLTDRDAEPADLVTDPAPVAPGSGAAGSPTAADRDAEPEAHEPNATVTDRDSAASGSPAGANAEPNAPGTTWHPPDQADDSGPAVLGGHPTGEGTPRWDADQGTAGFGRSGPGVSGLGASHLGAGAAWTGAPGAGGPGAGGAAGYPSRGVVGSRGSDRGWAVLGIAALVVVAAIALLWSWPWLSVVFSSGHLPSRESQARMYFNTWAPPLLSAAVSVGTAYLAALGIGGLRPLGRKSEWLLLLFAPWLFVGVGPLSIADFENARHLHLLNHFLGLVPPILLSVPSLLVLTLFCRTRAARWRAAQAGGSAAFINLVALPALPLAIFMAGVTVFFGANNVLWPTTVGGGIDTQTAQTSLLRQLSEYAGTQNLPYGITTPLIVVVLAFIVLAALQILYFDRLVILTGPPGEPGDDLPTGTFTPTPSHQWPAEAAYPPPPTGAAHFLPPAGGAHASTSPPQPTTPWVPQPGPPTGHPAPPHPPAGYPAAPAPGTPPGYPQTNAPSGYPQTSPPADYPQMAAPSGYPGQPSYPAGYPTPPSPTPGYPPPTGPPPAYPTQAAPPGYPAPASPPPAYPGQPAPPPAYLGQATPPPAHPRQTDPPPAHPGQSGPPPAYPSLADPSTAYPGQAGPPRYPPPAASAASTPAAPSPPSPAGSPPGANEPPPGTDDGPPADEVTTPEPDTPENSEDDRPA